MATTPTSDAQNAAKLFYFDATTGQFVPATTTTPLPVSIGGSSGSGALQVATMPPGILQAQAEITSTLTAATLTLSSPAKAVELTLRDQRDGTASIPTLGAEVAYVCFDPPSTAVRDVWLNPASAGVPRVDVTTHDGVVKLAFNDAAGNPVTVSTMGYDFGIADANVILSVKVIS